MENRYTPCYMVDQPFYSSYPDFTSDLIPLKKFAEPFSKVLDKIIGLVTKTERKLLYWLEYYCMEDGLIYPKQKTLASRLGVNERHVRRLLNSLVKKKFVEVVHASLVDRHLFGMANRYKLLNHPIYIAIAVEMSSETGGVPYYTVFKSNQAHAYLNGPLSDDRFCGLNADKDPQDIFDALQITRKKMENGKYIRFPMRFAQKIVNRKDEDRKIQANAAKLAHNVALNLAAMPDPKHPPKSPQEINSDRNRILTDHDPG